jgi:hypothetical protein
MWLRYIVPLILTTLLCGWTHGALQSSFWNGKLTQTTLSFLNYGGDFVPIDRYKDCSAQSGDAWLTGSSNAQVPFSDYNANGFPSNSSDLTSEGGWYCYILIPSSSERSGNYNVTINGPGVTTLNPGWTSLVSTGTCSTSGSTIFQASAGVSCTATVSYSGTTQPKILITSVTNGDGPTSINIYNVNDQTAFNAGKVCGSSQFSTLMNSAFGVQRYLNKSNNLYSQEVVWADRTPLTWHSWAGGDYFPSSALTTNLITQSSGQEYTLAFSGFTLTNGVHVVANFVSSITPPSFTASGNQSSGNTLVLTSTTGIVNGMLAADGSSGHGIIPTVYVTNVNSGTNTVTFSGSPYAQGNVSNGDTIYFSTMLNVNSTGYVPVVLTNGTVFGQQNSTITINALWSALTYDAGLGGGSGSAGAWILNNGQALAGGWPPEIQVQCANEIGAHPWFLPPMQSLDPPTNYMPSFVSYAKSNLSAGLIPRWELCPNEDWNDFNTVTGYSWNKEYPRSGINYDSANWCGRVGAQLGNTIYTAYGGNTGLYQADMCVFAGGIPSAIALSSGSYNSVTGLVTLIASSAPVGFGSGQPIAIRGVTGTGSVASINGAFTSGSGSTSTTIKYTIATGLTLTISASTGYFEFGTTETAKFNSWEYVTNGGYPAATYATHVCPAYYYSSAYTDTVTEIGWAWWYANGGTANTLVNDFVAGAYLSGFNNNLYWVLNTLVPDVTGYAATYSAIKATGYEGHYESNNGGENTQTQTQAVSAVTPGSTTVLTVGSNAWNYICNTASGCTGGQPTTLLSGFTSSNCNLNSNDVAVLSATATTITVNYNSSTGNSGCTTGAATYDGSATYVPAFEQAVKLNTNASGLYAAELAYLQGLYNAGVVFPPVYDVADFTDWACVYPDIYGTANSPCLNAVQEFQTTPYLLRRDLDPASNDNDPVGINKAA